MRLENQLPNSSGATAKLTNGLNSIDMEAAGWSFVLSEIALIGKRSPVWSLLAYMVDTKIVSGRSAARISSGRITIDRLNDGYFKSIFLDQVLNRFKDGMVLNSRGQ